MSDDIELSMDDVLDGTTSVEESSENTATGDELFSGYDFSAFNLPEDKESQPAEIEVPGFYAKVLDDTIPAEIKAALLPRLEDMDRGVNKRMQGIHEEYAPFKQFREQNIDSDYISQAVGVAQNIENNPLGVYQLLREKLIENNMLPNENTQDEEDSEIISPMQQQLNELRQQNEQFQQMFQNQYQQQQQQQQEEQSRQQQYQIETQLTNEVTDLEKAIGGTLNDGIRREIFMRMQAMENSNGGKEVSVKEAYVDLVRTSQAIAGARRGPRVLGGTNSHASQTQNSAELTPDQQASLMDSILDRG